jgi:hypothetical protein
VKQRRLTLHISISLSKKNYHDDTVIALLANAISNDIKKIAQPEHVVVTWEREPNE